MTTKIYPFIMCGGAGTRLWPMSTQARPKQFHKIVSDLSMLQETASRGDKAGSLKVEAPSFVCAAAHKDLVLSQCEEIGLRPHKVILEPLPKNTAAVASVIGLSMMECEEDALVLLLPADHYIQDVSAFWSYVESGVQSAQAGNIVTFGIRPTHPETGYGYIRSGATTADGSREIAEFVEKPDLDTAREYLAKGGYYWNAGIFLFQPKVIQGAFEEHAADIQKSVEVTLSESKTVDNLIYLDPVQFDNCRSESFDYAIMEKAENISLIGPVDIGWNDIGSWRAVWEHAQKTGTDDVMAGYSAETHTCQIDSANVLLKSTGPFVATVGVSNLAVIATDDSVLVIDLYKAQDVKRVVQALKDANIKDLL